MILETVGSFASIIGLSVQLIDKYRNKYPDEFGEAFAALKALSVTGQTWKEIHTKYHAIERNVGIVLSPLERINDGRRELIPKEQVSPYHLRQAFNDANWQNYIESHETEIKPFIDTLKHASSKAEKSADNILQALREQGHFNTAEKISALVINQSKIVELNSEFNAFLKCLKDELKNENWSQEQVELVLRNRELLRTRIPMVIGSTDRALMAILDLYNEIINEI
ncbi:TPA: hypothetical protein ACGF6J_003621 [Vibrio cholerae]